MILKAENITKSFNTLDSTIKVLDGVDLSIEQNEYVSIVGASGAGKSTLLQILATLASPDSGALRYYVTNELDPFKLNDKDLSNLRNNNIGFIFQFHHLLPEFSAFENVIIPAIIAGKNKKDYQSRALKLIDFVGVSHRIDHKPSELSGGEQQRFAIARALINNPDIVFADEPTGNLDEKNTELVLELISNLQQEYNLTFVTATHSMDVANKANRMLRISNGKMEISS